MTHYISSTRLSLERMKEILDNREKIALSHESTEAVIKCRKYLDDKMKDIRHIEAIIAKQRNGRTGVAHLLFSKPFSRYDSLSKEWEQQYEDLARQKYDD